MTELREFYRERAGNFLQTVVCFDDKVGLETDLAPVAKSAVRSEDGFTEPIKDEAPSTEKVEPSEESFGSAGKLDARLLTEKFAEKGILCSVIVPRLKAEEIKSQILRLVPIADVSILDWKLDDKDATITRDAIVEIVKEDRESGGRLRLIVIYSVGDGLDIMSELSEKLKEEGFSLDAENLEIKGEHTEIVFFQKPTAKPTASVVSYDILPERVVEKFTDLSSGLLPAAALTAITEIRSNTHHLLASFPAALDGAFLAHRALIPDPEDAEQFLLDLIEAEIGILLDRGSTNKAVGADRCKQWIEACALKEVEMTRLKKAISKYSEYKMAGFRCLFPSQDLSERQLAEKVLELLYVDNRQDLQKAKEQLSILATLDQRPNKYRDKPPRLRLGSIVKDMVDSRYLLCIQPLCDSVRIKHNEDTFYPFMVLALETSPQKESSLDICIPSEENTNAVWLSVTSKPSSLLSFPFRAKSAKERYVEAVLEEDSWVFRASQSSTALRWVADLKIGKAQRIVSELAARIHTLGIDEFEWMRLHQLRRG